jgi:hypothetical protein
MARIISRITSLIRKPQTYSGPVHVSPLACGAEAGRLPDGSLRITIPDWCDVYHDEKLYICRPWGPVHIIGIKGEKNLLLSDPLRAVLERGCGTSVQFLPAVAIDAFNGKRVMQYSESILEEEISVKTFSSVEWSGDRAWRFTRNNLFVTMSVRKKIESAGLRGLNFSTAFESFFD